jgi:hypothetical protein
MNHKHFLAEGSTALFAVCPAMKGIDNDVIPINSIDEFDYKFGDLDLARFGQTGYNVRKWVSAGGLAYVIRPLPENARYANTILKAKEELEKDSDGNITKVKLTNFIQSAGVDAQSVASLALHLNTVEDADDSDDNTNIYRLLAVYPTGRGKDYYENLAYKLTVNRDLESTYTDFRVYNFTIIEKTSSGAEKEIDTLLVSLYENALDLSNESLFIDDVLNKYSTFLKTKFNKEAYEKICRDINPDVNPYLLDIFEGIELKIDIENDTKKMEKLELQSETIDFENTNLYLIDGFIGTYDSDGNEITKAAHWEKLLVEGYEGSLVPKISNKKKYPIDVILGANYSNPVRNAIIQFCTKTRKDFVTLDDTGLQASYEQELEFRKNHMTDNYLVSYFTNNCVVEFPYGERKLTSTYLLADKIPNNDNNFGIYKNFAGPRRGGIEGYKSLAYELTPFMEEQLYKKQLNYFVEEENRSYLKTQLTSQTVTSILSDINHVRELLRIQRDIENSLEDFIMEDITGDTLSAINLRCTEIMEEHKLALESYAVNVTASEYDKKQKRARVYIEIQFKHVLERILIDFVTK